MIFRRTVLFLVIINTFLPLWLSALSIYEIANEDKLEINYFKLYKDYKFDSLNLCLLANRPFEVMENTTIRAAANKSQIVSFQLCNNSQEQKSRFLYFTSIDFSSITAYSNEGDKMVEEIEKVGFDHPHFSRTFKNSRPIFEFKVGSNSCQTIYLKIDQKYLSVNTRVYLYTAAQLSQRVENMSFDGGIDIGISMTYFVATFILILFFIMELLNALLNKAISVFFCVRSFENDLPSSLFTMNSASPSRRIR